MLTPSPSGGKLSRYEEPTLGVDTACRFPIRTDGAAGAFRDPFAAWVWTVRTTATFNARHGCVLPRSFLCPCAVRALGSAQSSGSARASWPAGRRDRGIDLRGSCFSSAHCARCVLLCSPRPEDSRRCRWRVACGSATSTRAICSSLSKPVKRGVQREPPKRNRCRAGHDEIQPSAGGNSQPDKGLQAFYGTPSAENGLWPASPDLLATKA
jgi:hypothetical protein